MHYVFHWHGVKVRPGPQDPRLQDPGIRNPGLPSKFKSGTPGPPTKFKKWNLHNNISSLLYIYNMEIIFHE